MAAAAAASSSNPTLQWKYDVFLSFRGEDTRNNFTSHLYAALSDKAIETFIDNELVRGEEISPALLKAIEESKISIIILSENYASSSWCLDELLKILECKNTNGQLVIPVFYRIDPSDVRKQTRSFAEAFAKHELKEKLDKVNKWRDALTNVANLAGHPWQQDRPESILLQDIIKDILEKLYRTSSSDFNGLVGIDSPIEQIKSLLRIGLESACIVVGIWGMGGIGKTTIAKAIFNQISGQFTDCCFLENVREVSEKHGVVALRKELLGEILKDENIKRGTVNLESTFISKRLGRKKVFIVLDDVSDSSQLESIIGRLDRFGKGSKIIITTRNIQVLKKGVDGIYEVKELNYHYALRLFSFEAFKQNYPIEEFMELSKLVVNYAKGNPLALKVLGSFLFGRSKRQWESALDKLKETPNMEIQKVLRISYDGLDQKEKDIFCDIACFFNGENKDYVMEILDGCGLYAEIGISVLIEKSLLTISNNDLRMHDLLQEMGWEIVREVSEEPGERSRLWNHEDVCHVLIEETGTKAVKGIFLDLSEKRDVYLSSTAFKGMFNLRLLKIYRYDRPRFAESSHKLHFPQGLISLSNKLSYLHWQEYPLKSLPQNFHPEYLVELDLSYSKVKHLWEGTQPLVNLRRINLMNCEDLIKIPDLSIAPNLEQMYLEGCESLLEVDSSIQYLIKLKVLTLGKCKKLTSLPSTINLKSLSQLYLNDCSNLKNFAEISWKIEKLNLSGIPMEDLPSSFENLFGIWTQCLWYLCLDDCNLSKIPDSLGSLSSLRSLSLRGNNFVSIPASIKHLSQLARLDLCYCKRLQSLPELPSSLTNLCAYDCISLQTISISSIRILTGVEQSLLMMFRFGNCFELDQNTRRQIMADAQLKIQFVATTFLKEMNYMMTAQLPLQSYNDKLLSCVLCGVIEDHSDVKEKLELMIVRVMNQVLPPFTLLFPGSEIPEWFSYTSSGPLVTAQLPLHWYNSKFIGFALCVVVACDRCYRDGYFGVECKMKTYQGEIYDNLSKFWVWDGSRFESEHMILWYENCLGVRELKGDNWFRNYCYNEASFQFDALQDCCRVEKCGVHLLYSQDEYECNRSIIQVDQDVWEPHPKRLKASLDSTAETCDANGGDWQEEVYQKIKAMNDMYLPELNEMYQLIAAKLQQHDSLLQQLNSEQLDNLKKLKTTLERVITFLLVSKENVLPGYKERLGSHEKLIIYLVTVYRRRNPVPSLQQEQIPPTQGPPPTSQMQSLQQPRSQITQVQSHENQTNPQLQSMNLQGSAAEQCSFAAARTTSPTPRTTSHISNAVHATATVSDYSSAVS